MKTRCAFTLTGSPSKEVCEEYMQLELLDHPTEAQTAKASSLVKQHGGEWLGPARPYIRSFAYAREPCGFLERLDCEAPRFIEGFEHIVKLGPRMRVVVTSMRTRRRDTEAKMAKLPLGELWTLLSANALDDKSLATLAPAMKGLRALSLFPTVRFGGAPARELVNGYARHHPDTGVPFASAAPNPAGCAVTRADRQAQGAARASYARSEWWLRDGRRSDPGGDRESRSVSLP
jgi:hypothetical protein